MQLLAQQRQAEGGGSSAASWVPWCSPAEGALFYAVLGVRWGGAGLIAAGDHLREALREFRLVVSSRRCFICPGYAAHGEAGALADHRCLRGERCAGSGHRVGSVLHPGGRDLPPKEDPAAAEHIRFAEQRGALLGRIFPILWPSALGCRDSKGPGTALPAHAVAVHTDCGPAGGAGAPAQPSRVARSCWNPAADGDSWVSMGGTAGRRRRWWRW